MFGSLASGLVPWFGAHGQTVDFYLSETRGRKAAKLFLKKALANADNRALHVFARDGLRSYPAALRELQAEGHVERRCRQRVRRYCNNRIEGDHRHVKRRLRAMQGPRTAATGWAAIQGIEAAHMIKKGQVLGGTCTRKLGCLEPCSGKGNVGHRKPLPLPGTVQTKMQHRPLAR